MGKMQPARHVRKRKHRPQRLWLRDVHVRRRKQPQLSAALLELLEIIGEQSESAEAEEGHGNRNTVRGMEDATNHVQHPTLPRQVGDDDLRLWNLHGSAGQSFESESAHAYFPASQTRPATVPPFSTMNTSTAKTW